MLMKMKECRDPMSVSVSVIVPCKNERDNVEHIVKRIPRIGRFTEILFCDDRSIDGTAETVSRISQMHPDKIIRLVTGPDLGKAENVRTGFEAAQGDVLIILDGDLTVMPEELPPFFNALAEGRADFVNGTRFVFAVPKKAMKRINKIGNIIFSFILSFLLDQRITDTLCGTKAMWRSDWERIKGFRGSWGAKDRWGDFELLLGARMLNFRILEVPVHYQERVYGESKMKNLFANGLNMLRICGTALFRMKAGTGS